MHNFCFCLFSYFLALNCLFFSDAKAFPGYLTLTVRDYRFLIPGLEMKGGRRAQTPPAFNV